MSQTILIQSINYDGEMATVLFKPDNANVVVNLGNVILPYLFDPSLLTPPREIYGTYTILVLGDDGNCKTDCPNILQVPRPTPTPTPTITPTKTQTPTPTQTITPTPTFDPCKVPTPTPTTTSTPTITPTNTPTPSSTCTNPCGCPEPSKTPKPQKTPRPTPSPTNGYCYPTPTPTPTTPLVSMSLFALYSSGSTNIEYQISINVPSTKNINITFDNILFLRSGDPIVLTGQTISILSGQTFNVTSERIDTDYYNLNGIIGFDDFFVTANGQPILYQIFTSYSFLQPLSTPTPTPTKTLTPTPTKTLTPTPTPSSGVLIDPLLIGSDEYIEVGSGEYLKFVDPTPTPTPTITQTPTPSSGR